MAATLCKNLRQHLLPVVPVPESKQMQITFSGAFSKWLQCLHLTGMAPTNQLPFISGFNFSENSSITERFKVNFSVAISSDGIIQLTIPALTPAVAIAAPAHTSSVNCIITAASYMLAGGSVKESSTHHFAIPYNDDTIAAQIILLLLQVVTGAVIITAARLKYKLTNENICSNPLFMPASVIGARYL